MAVPTQYAGVIASLVPPRACWHAVGLVWGVVVTAAVVVGATVAVVVVLVVVVVVVVAAVVNSADVGSWEGGGGDPYYSVESSAEPAALGRCWVATYHVVATVSILASSWL